MNNIYQKILDANIELHRIEARHFETVHPEEFNWFEQKQIWQDLKAIQRHLLKGGVVLDLGCGTGNIFLKLLQLGFEVWGVDISEEMLEVLRNRIPSQFKNKVRLFSQNIDDFIGSCSQRFDLITMNSVLHHLPKYLETLNRVLSLLNPRGWVYINHEPTKNALSQDRFLRKILWQVDNLLYLILNVSRIPQLEQRNWRMSDYHLYSGFDEEAVILECRKAKLKVMKFVRYSSAMRLGFSCWIDSNLLKSKSQFHLIAQKEIL